MPHRLAVKLILSLTPIIVIVEGLFGYINVRTQERQLLENMVRGADQLSRSITSATWHAMLADHRDSAYEVMQTIAHKQGIDRIRIFNKEGRVTFSTVAADLDTQVDTKAEACFLCHAEAAPLVRVDVPSRARIFRAPGGTRTLGMVTPIYNEPACSGADCHAHPASRNVLGVLDVGLRLDLVDREVSGIRQRMFLVVGVEILLIGLFTVLFTRRFVGKPIGELIEGTRAVANMELDQPVGASSTGELGELAASFNVMRERLKEAVTELNDLTRSLEAKVERRTAQLQAAQHKLQQSERLASLGQLAATVAHEINNPMAGVLNFSMLMQRILKEDGIPPGRVEEFRGYLAQVVNETARVGRIVSDLLSFSRRPKPRGSRADLNAVVRTTLDVLAHRFARAGVAVEEDLLPGLAPVRGDAVQLHQVVTNLVVNGIEAMPGGGTLTVRTRSCGAAGTAVLEVADTGTGIAREHLPRIFDPFFTTKEEGKGVGLGLAVVYGIVEGHEGDIEVESTEGHGTLFRVTLPVAGDGDRTTTAGGGER